MFSDEATKLPTLTFAPLPISTPFGFTINTRPLALSEPRMVVGSTELMRFRTAEVALFWLKFSVSLAPTFIWSQLTIILLLVWVTVVVLPLRLMLPEPSTMVPLPTACAAWALASINAASAMERMCVGVCFMSFIQVVG